MECADVKLLLHGHLDGELELATDLEVERHIESCERCSREFADLRELRSALRAGELHYSAPATLESQVLAAIGAAHRGERRSVLSSRWIPRSLELAIPVALAAVLAVFLIPRVLQPSRTDLLTQQVLSSHVRSLIGNHLLDVVSSDHHTVKPWFAGKLDYSPPVTDFSTDGFPLAGARIDYLDDRPVAALVYRHNKHEINAFVWPIGPNQHPSAAAERAGGYNVLTFSGNGMTWWLISDTSADELAKLAVLLRDRNG